MFVIFDPRPARYKVRFSNEKSELQAHEVLLRTGWVETLGDSCLGFSSDRQLKALKKSKIKFELLK